MAATAVGPPPTPARKTPERAATPGARHGVHLADVPLVAVVGLVGGAGTTTLAYLLARRAARHNHAPVLLAELHDQGALALLTRCGSDRALAGLAAALDAGIPVDAPCVAVGGSLHVVAATQPTLDSYVPVAEAALERVLADARATHRLVVVDAGPLTNPAAAPLLRHASQIVLVTAAWPQALTQVERLGASGSLPRHGKAATTLAVVRTRPGRKSSVRDARRLAERHVDRLLLVPHVPALSDGRPDRIAPELEPVYAAFDVLLRGAP
jgi:MinD-like ATPase involved in chromosome partitioning or flagellar assembly